jgi:MOSC domain-containing protein YiiM
MHVVALCYCPDDGGSMLSVPEITLVAGAGIVGDRYYDAEQGHPGQNLTLIEAEEIEAFNARNGTAIALTDPRRNVVTRKVRLNSLVGRVFSIGAITLRGVQLCEPCGTLATHLAATGLSKVVFVREFTHRAGLRADVLNSGSIRVRDSVVVQGNDRN